MNIFKKYNKDLKRIGALVLTAAMAVGGVPEFGVMDARAAVLENVLGTTPVGSNENTAYNLKSISPAVIDYSMKSGTSGYSANPLHKTTYDFRGFNTRYAFFKPYDAYSDGDSSTLKKAISPKISFAADGKPNGVEFMTQGSMIRDFNTLGNGQVQIVENPDSSAVESDGSRKKVEVRQTIKPSDDQRYLILEYKVHNLSGTKQDFIIGSAADLSLIDQDNASMVLTRQDDVPNNEYQGLHIHATGGAPNATRKVGGGHVLSTLDIYTDLLDAKYGVGIDRRGTGDKSRLGVWAGAYSTKSDHTENRTGNANYGEFIFSKFDKEIILEDGDTAAAFSAYFDLDPFETKTARFAISAKEHVYYVTGQEPSISGNIGKDTGYMASPVVKKNQQSSIERVIQKTKTDNLQGGLPQNKVIYVMLQGNETIEKSIVIESGYTVKLMTADYGTPAFRRETDPLYSASRGASAAGMQYNIGTGIPKPISRSTLGTVDGKFTLTRGVGFTGPMFVVQPGAKLEISDVIIDGNKAAIDAHNAAIVETNQTLSTYGTRFDGKDVDADPTNDNEGIIYVNSPLIQNEGELVVGSGATLQNADTSHARSLVRSKTAYYDKKLETYIDNSGPTAVERTREIYDLQVGYTFKDLGTLGGSGVASAISNAKATATITFRGGTIRDNISSSGDLGSRSDNLFHNADGVEDSSLKNLPVATGGAVMGHTGSTDGIILDTNEKIIINGNTTRGYRFEEVQRPKVSSAPADPIRFATKSMTRIPGGQSNLYLTHHDAVVIVKNDTGVLNTNSLSGETSIGIRINNPPGSNTQGREIVKMKEDTNPNQPMRFVTNNFSSDNGYMRRMGTTGHTRSNVGGGNELQKRLYIKAAFSKIQFNFQDENGIPMAPRKFNASTSGLAAEMNIGGTNGIVNGSTRTTTFEPPTGYRIHEVIITPEGTVPAPSFTNDYGTVTISNIQEDKKVTVKFTRKKSRYTFDLRLKADGSVTEDVNLRSFAEDMDASVTTSSIVAPIPSRNGYTFKGWQGYTNAATIANKAYDPGVDTKIGALIQTVPIERPNAERDLYYYAEWETNVLSIPLNIKYINSNTNPSIVFANQNETKDGSKPFDWEMPKIAGYKHTMLPADRTLDGDFGTAVSVTELSPSTEQTGPYKFSGVMPGMSAGLTFKYKVDPNQRFRFTKKYVDQNGQDILKPNSSDTYTESVLKNAEEAIDSQRVTIPGYTYQGLEVVHAEAPDIATYKLGIYSFTQQPILDETSGTFSGYMPNQHVTIVYKYLDNNPSQPYRKIVIDDSTHKENGKTLLINRLADATAATFPQVSDTQNQQFYGFTYKGIVSNPMSADVDANGNITTNLSTITNGTLVLGVMKGNEWHNLKFGFVGNGFGSYGTMQYPGSDQTISILTSDGTALGNQKAMKFGEIKENPAFPTAVPGYYYLFDGWFKNSAGTTAMQDSDIFSKNSAAPFEHVVYAKIIEDPSKWVDVNFVTSDPALGTLSPVTTEGIYIPGSLAQHLHFDAVWNTITKPVATPIANYELKGWIAPDGTNVTDTSVIQAGTYTAVFGKKDATWGLGVGAFGATGSIGSDGSGTVTVTGVTPGNVYVVTDPDGNIVGVATGTSGDLNFPGLVPGRTYNVVEGTPDTVAQVGRPASSITGSNVSAPKPVIIPAIGDNKSVGVDPKNPERAQIVVNPADPDAEYALIDSNGNVVPYPSSNGGWMTPVGSGPATVTFNDLDPGETYTVVARKKGNASETPLGNLHAGVPVVANPGSMVEAQNYIIETKTNGVNANVKVAMVAGENVNNTIYTETKANSTFSIHADPTDSAGNPFMHWVIMNGRIPGVSGKILSAEYSGKIAQSNVIFNAVYDVKPRNASGELIAPVEQGNRGNAAEGEFALDPETIAQLEQELSKPTDVSLININGADVRYKVLFDKRTTKSTESNLIKDVPSSVWTNYPDAFTTAWSLDVKEERYVDGRLVQNATPSNASLKLVVQLEGQDADMLDYEIWDMGRRVDDSWNPVTPTLVSQVHFTEDVANNAGYMSFMGNVNHTYVLVYSKTFKLYFIDNNPTLDHRYLGDTDRNFFKKMKVRRKHVVTSLEYATDYRDVTDYADQGVAHLLVSPFDDIYGVTHTYDNWSLRDMPASIRVFDPENEVTRTQSVFAFYNNNRAEVTKARTDLTNLIPVAVNLKSSPYLIESDVNELNDAIAEAQNVLDRIRGRLEKGVDPLRMANYPQLQAAIDALQRVIDRMNAKINAQNARYISRTGGSSGGGSGSSGRGGGGSIGTPLDGTNYKNLPLSADRQNTFTLGVDGRWTINPMTGRWAFSLNGGLPLNDKWARIDYTDATGAQVTDWYRFDLQSSMATGWFYDNEYKGWYYLNPADGKDIGKMVRGWHKDENTNKWYYLNKEWGSMQTGWHNDSDDGRWYYLDPTSGEMAIGWHFINGKWYFFNMVNSAPTWALVDGKWVYGNSNIRPYGAMYVNEVTPDGYRVDANGAWIP